jgi:hypothetical protein
VLRGGEDPRVSVNGRARDEHETRVLSARGRRESFRQGDVRLVQVRAEVVRPHAGKSSEVDDGIDTACVRDGRTLDPDVRAAGGERGRGSGTGERRVASREVVNAADFAALVEEGVAEAGADEAETTRDEHAAGHS